MERNATRRSPVMADVAQAAGVSHQTVSRVLNGHPNVREETRAKVLRAVEHLGYRRNMMARALVTRRSRTLGVVVFGATFHGPARTLYGLEQAAREAGYFVSIVGLKTPGAAEMQEALSYLADRGVDGIIVVTPRLAAVSESVTPGMPVVSIGDGVAAGTPMPFVDQVAGARLVTKHLLELGHETVWHVSGPPDWQETASRAEGWRTALALAGRWTPEPMPGDWSARSGYAAGCRLLREPEVTAVFAANDQMALGLLRAFAEAGVGVPAQVSVVGFDDIPESEFFSPPLTTVRPDFESAGRQGFELLLELMEKGQAETFKRCAIQPLVIARQSAAGPAATHACDGPDRH